MTTETLPGYDVATQQGWRGSNVAATDLPGKWPRSRVSIRHRVPVWHVAGKAAAKPIAVEIKRSEEGCLVMNESLRVYGSGDTLEEALRDFATELMDLWNHYNSTPADRLIGEARRLKELYSGLF